MEKNKKLKIVFLSLYSGKVNRGVETYVHELSNNFIKMGHSVFVYQSGEEISGSLYKTVVLDKLNFTKNALKLIAKDTDILFATNGGFQSLLLKIWTFGKKTKLVIPGQSGLGRDDKFNLLCFPDLFIGLTEFQSNWARKFNPFVNIVTIPNGVDIFKFKPNGIKKDFGLSHPIVMSSGALEKIKRFDLVIRAIAKIPNVSLLLVGKGSLKKELQKMGNDMIANRFKIIEAKHEEMPAIYRSVDLFTYSTQPYESFGIVMLEAMASNLSVVTSNDPIRMSIVGDSGYFVDPTDTIAYANTIDKALGKKWGEEPRQNATKFDWNIIAKKYIDVFNKILK